MATFTENYSLIKPDGEDYYDVTDFNENMDTLDGLMAAAEQNMEGITEKIGTPSETGQTLFSLLEQGSRITFQSLFKSVQRVKIASPNKTVAISRVNPAKCLVFVERIYNQSDALRSYEYILHADQIEMTTFSNANQDVILAFNILEFY